MREIKFRAWDKKLKIMIQPTDTFADFIAFDGTIHEIGEYSNYSGGGKTDEDVSSQYELMQYTGLKDKNGKEIYEGDVIDVKDEGFPFVKDWIGIVKFIEGSYLIENLEGTDGEYLFDELREIEVIGNIYENSDLLAVIES